MSIADGLIPKAKSRETDHRGDRLIPGPPICHPGLCPLSQRWHPPQLTSTWTLGPGPTIDTEPEPAGGSTNICFACYVPERAQRSLAPSVCVTYRLASSISFLNVFSSCTRLASPIPDPFQPCFVYATLHLSTFVPGRRGNFSRTRTLRCLRWMKNQRGRKIDADASVRSPFHPAPHHGRLHSGCDGGLFVGS